MKPFSWDLKAQGDRTVTGDQAQASGTQGLVSCSLQPTVLGLCPWPQPMGMSMGAVCVCVHWYVYAWQGACVHVCMYSFGARGQIAAARAGPTQCYSAGMGMGTGHTSTTGPLHIPASCSWHIPTPHCRPGPPAALCLSVFSQKGPKGS